jgi:tetratricopeptide (TPR) repeat protein/transcriptional regulator with XRE-family HTH domain
VLGSDGWAGEEAVRAVTSQPMPDLAGLLQQLRAKAGLTQEELAEAAGLSPRTVSDLERGIHRSARPNTVRLLADALELPEPVRRSLVAAASGQLSTTLEPPAHRANPVAPAARIAGSPWQPAVMATVPRELPADVGAFTGRSAELARLDALIPVAKNDATDGPVVISAVSGSAGAGKTALAMRWAHQAAERFPDGQLYVNLRGYDPEQPVSASEALAGFLRALGVPSRDIPVDEAERAARYRSLLAGRRMLVVLDNAATEDQVRPLLPGKAGVMVLVTSRDSLPGLVARDGAQRLELDVLPTADAISLLRALIGERVDAAPEAARTLAEQCARLPLALRVAAELAAVRPHTPLAELTTELASEEKRLDLLDAGGDRRAAVTSVFSWSYYQLPAAAARMFRALGLHPGPDFDRFAAAALAGTGADEAGRLLILLARAHLIQPVGSQRFGMHDLLRAYAARLASAHEGMQARRAARTRLFDYYLASVVAAMNVLVPVERRDFDRPAETIVPELTGPLARIWLDAERGTLVAVAAYTARHGWPRCTIRLAETLFRYLDGEYHAEALAIYTYAEQAARACGDHVAQIRVLTRIAGFYCWQARFPQALDRYQAALAAAEAVDDRACKLLILTDLGGMRLQQGRYRQAVQCHEQALALARELASTLAEVIALDNLATIYLLQGHYQLGLEYQQRAFALYRQVAPPADVAVLPPAGLGGDHHLQGRYQQIVVYYRRHIALSRQLGDRYGEADTLIRLGRISHLLDRLEQALSYHLEALALFQDAGDRSREADALNGIGECLVASNQQAKAHARHAAALTLARETGDRQQQGRALAGLAAAELIQGSYERAIGYYRQALPMFRDIGDSGGEISALNGAGECLLAAGDQAHARSYLLAALALARDTGDRYQQARTHRCLARAYHAAHRAEQADVHRRNALEICADLDIFVPENA